MRIAQRSFTSALFAQLLFLAICFPSLSMAEIKPGNMVFSFNLGQYTFEGMQNIKNDITYGFSLGYNINETWSIEALINKVDTEVKNLGVGVNGSIYRLEGHYNFNPKKKLVPYVAAGIGWINLDYDTAGSDTGTLFDYGGGLSYSLTDTISLRGDLRHVLAYSNPINNFIFSFGISVSFGVGKKARAGVREKPSERDSDGDGVSDSMDRCPGTRSGVEVDDKGCPKPLEKPVFLTLNIEFEKNSAKISPIYHAILKKVADFLKSHPKTEATVEGHTDSKGKASYNMNLSAKRAQSVVNYLVDKFGIDEKRLKAIGYGESRPIADNATPDGRKQNRRVTVEIYSAKGK